MTDDNPLMDLVVDDTVALDREKLKNILKPYVIFDKTGAISLLHPFDKLSNKGKILILLTTAKAKSLIFPESEDGMTPSEIISMDIMAEGSVKSTLKNLLEKSRSIKKQPSGKYYVPNYKLANLDSELGKEE